MVDRRAEPDKKLCACPLCGPAGALIPSSTYGDHQRTLKRERQLTIARNASGILSSSQPSHEITHQLGSQAQSPTAISKSSNVEPTHLSSSALHISLLLDELRDLELSYLSGLEFVGDPRTVGPYIMQPNFNVVPRSDNLYALAPRSSRNRAHRDRENRLRSISADVQSWEESTGKDEVKSALDTAMVFLDIQKALAWSLQRDSANATIVHTGMCCFLHSTRSRTDIQNRRGLLPFSDSVPRRTVLVPMLHDRPDAIYIRQFDSRVLEAAFDRLPSHCFKTSRNSTFGAPHPERHSRHLETVQPSGSRCRSLCDLHILLEAVPHLQVQCRGNADLPAQGDSRKCYL